MVQALAYRRVLLKLSGEALIGDQGYGIDATMLQYIANEIHEQNFSENMVPGQKGA